MLCDSEIIKRLDEFSFTTDNESRTFSPEDQIKIASVDLRLSNKYWRPKSSISPVKFRPEAFGSDTVNLFDECTVTEGESITIKPNSFLLCRTYESFMVPNDLVARLHSRSSFARLGIQVSSTSDFINPGWSGHMPLVIVNSSPFPLELRPFDRIAQVCFSPLTGEPKSDYVQHESVVKYDNDDGGPSSLWLDICREGLNNTNFNGREKDIDKILVFAKLLNEPTRAYFLKGLTKTSSAESVNELIEKFISNLKSEKVSYQILALIGGPIISFTLFWVILDIIGVAEKSIFLTFLAVFLDVIFFAMAHSWINKLDEINVIESYRKEVG